MSNDFEVGHAARRETGWTARFLLTIGLAKREVEDTLSIAIRSHLSSARAATEKRCVYPFNSPDFAEISSSVPVSVDELLIVLAHAKSKTWNEPASSECALKVADET